MKKKITLLIITLTLIASLIPVSVSAGTIRTSLEAQFEDGGFGNHYTIEAGKSETIQFFIGEDDGNDFRIEKKINAKEEDFEVYEESNSIDSKLDIVFLENGKIRVEPNKNIIPQTVFSIKYIGSELSFTSSDSITLVVKPNSGQIAKFKKSTVSGLKATSGENGVYLTFNKLKKANSYSIYRSTKKKSGYQLIAKVANNEFCDNIALKKGTRYYYKVYGRINKGNTSVQTKSAATISSTPTKSFAKATAKNITNAKLNSHDKSLLKEAYMFGLPSNIKFKHNATKEKDILNNLQYAFLIGDYELGFAYKSKAKATAAQNKIHEILQYEEYDSIYADLFCAFNNCVLESQIDYIHGCYCVTISVMNASLTNSEIFSNQKAAINRVKEIATEFREKGLIKDGMSQKEIAEVYYDFVANEDVGYFSDDEISLYDGNCMLEDTPYSFLFDKMASCLGHTSTYNHFLHYEGIKAYGANNWFGNVPGENGHILSYIICDGQEYFTDTTQHIPLTDQNGIEKRVIFCDGALDKARKTAGMI